MSRLLLLFFLLNSFIALSQDYGHKNLFSSVIGENIKKYNKECEKAYSDSNFERAEFLFDSLVKNVINGSYMDNFKMRKLSGKIIQFHKFEKPVFLMTYASWCTPGIGEIPALNEIAEQYYKEIDFVILFWNSKKEVKKVSGEYSKKIHILYIDEMENTHNHVIECMKHSLGFPTSFFINENKKIVDIRRGVLHPYNEEYEISYELNYTSFLNGISLLKASIIKDDAVVVKQE